MSSIREKIEGKVIVRAEHYPDQEKFTIFLDNGWVLHFAATDQGKLYVVLNRENEHE